MTRELPQRGFPPRDRRPRSGSDMISCRAKSSSAAEEARRLLMRHVSNAYSARDRQSASSRATHLHHAEQLDDHRRRRGRRRRRRGACAVVGASPAAVGAPEREARVAVAADVRAATALAEQRVDRPDARCARLLHVRVVAQRQRRVRQRDDCRAGGRRSASGRGCGGGGIGGGGRGRRRGREPRERVGKERDVGVGEPDVRRAAECGHRRAHDRNLEASRARVAALAELLERAAAVAQRGLEEHGALRVGVLGGRRRTNRGGSRRTGAPPERVASVPEREREALVLRVDGELERERERWREREREREERVRRSGGGGGGVRTAAGEAACVRRRRRRRRRDPRAKRNSNTFHAHAHAHAHARNTRAAAP